MGCDIHGWVEVKKDDKWIAVQEIEDRSRNYKRFAALAGVRGEGPEPRGIPHDVSDTVRYHIEYWGVDGHSHSQMSLRDAAKVWLETDWAPNYHKKRYPILAYIGIASDDCTEDFRVVFWFDN